MTVVDTVSLLVGVKVHSYAGDTTGRSVSCLPHKGLKKKLMRKESNIRWKPISVCKVACSPLFLLTLNIKGKQFITFWQKCYTNFTLSHSVKLI